MAETVSVINRSASRLESRPLKRPGCPRATWSGFRSKQSARNASVPTGSIARRSAASGVVRVGVLVGVVSVLVGVVSVGVLVVRVGVGKLRDRAGLVLRGDVVVGERGRVVALRRGLLVARDGVGGMRAESIAQTPRPESPPPVTCSDPRSSRASLNWGNRASRRTQATSATSAGPYDVDQHPAELPAPWSPQATKTSAPPIPIRRAAPDGVREDRERIDERRHDPPPRRRRREASGAESEPGDEDREPAVPDVVADDLVPEMDGVARVDIADRVGREMDAVALRGDRAERERRPGAARRADENEHGAGEPDDGVRRGEVDPVGDARAGFADLAEELEEDADVVPGATARTKAASRRLTLRATAGSVVDTRRCYSRCGTPPVDSPAAWIFEYQEGLLPALRHPGVGGQFRLTPDEAADAASELGGPVVVKAQVLDRRPREGGRDLQAQGEPRRRARRPQRSSGSTSAATSCESFGSSARPRSRRSTTFR